jgi:cytochrome c553
MHKTNFRQTCRPRVGVVCIIAWLIAVASVFTWQKTEAASDVFTQKVAPIFAANCVFCHGGKIQRSGLDLRSLESVLRGGANGKVIVAGHPEQSLLYKLITHAQEPKMPQGMDKLSDADIASIADWIRALTPDTNTAATETGAPIRAAGYAITEKDKQFWSFRKPVRPTVPAVKNRSWVRNEIDAFVLSRLEKAGLAPAPLAEPRVLIRRLYLDLIGIPPTPEEVNEFVRNPSDAAYKKIIEKLLASPHYGERWGRHWLDLARYADSGGYEFDYDRPNAWRYRDWVIQSFNQDKPYDQFIREQLANDQLKPNDTESLIATGFCRNGPTVDNADNEETRMDELDDMVTTTSTVFLGLTVGCARCHDHKYDPIPQKDYYRMQAVFFRYKKADRALASSEEEAAFKARNKEVDEKVRPFRQKVFAIEKPHRDKLLAEKVEFHMKLAESTGVLKDKNIEEFRKEVATRFAKDVKLQPEEIDALLSAEETQARKVLQDQINEINKTRPKNLPAVMGVTDESKPVKAYLLKRGDYRSKGEEVHPGFPSVLAGDADITPQTPRKQLAEWIASAENPLTARVAVNRIWQYHFGKGLVRTPSDFGATGDRPSHPELLDWLATEFMAPRFGRSWSWKALHRLILTSSTYRQASRFDEKAAAKDPDNRLFWRMNPHRLEAEILRDSILTVSGKLNPEMFGPGIYPRIDSSVIASGSRPRWPLEVKEGANEWRRSVYIFVKRSVLVPLIEVFDCPVTVVSSPVRSVSTVSPQALALLNNEFVLQQSQYFAERVKREAGADLRAQISRAYQIALTRRPSARENLWATEFIKSQTEGYRKRNEEKPEEAALRDFCHALINLNEFLYVD